MKPKEAAGVREVDFRVFFNVQRFYAFSEVARFPVTGLSWRELQTTQIADGWYSSSGALAGILTYLLAKGAVVAKPNLPTGKRYFPTQAGMDAFVRFEWFVSDRVRRSMKARIVVAK